MEQYILIRVILLNHVSLFQIAEWCKEAGWYEIIGIQYTEANKAKTELYKLQHSTIN